MSWCRDEGLQTTDEVACRVHSWLYSGRVCPILGTYTEYAGLTSTSLVVQSLHRFDMSKANPAMTHIRQNATSLCMKESSDTLRRSGNITPSVQAATVLALRASSVENSSQMSGHCHSASGFMILATKAKLATAFRDYNTVPFSFQQCARPNFFSMDEAQGDVRGASWLDQGHDA